MNISERRRVASKHEEGMVDLISNMPDAILLLIFSRLESTEEVIRSSILSKRWRYLWTAIPCLNLKIGEGRADKKSEFKEFVDWVLGNRSVDLVSFRLSCWDYYSMSTVQRWIQATVMKNVKQLDLTLDPKLMNEDMVMSHCLVTCPSLEVFRLSYCGLLILPSFSGFPALRVLKLQCVMLFDGDLVKYFFESCCPLLEDLIFDDCWLEGLDLLCISCPNLKKLTIIMYEKDDDLCGCLKLSCPKLVSLKFSGHIASNYVVERLYSLKEAQIDSDSKTVRGLLPGISHVECLKIRLKHFYKYIKDAHIPALRNLKTLELLTLNATYTYEALIQVLKYCPKLESLSFTVESAHTYGSEEYDYMEFPKMDEAETRWILTPDVKWIEFFEFNGEKPKLDISWHGKENESEWMYVAARWGNKARYSR